MRARPVYWLLSIALLAVGTLQVTGRFREANKEGAFLSGKPVPIKTEEVLRLLTSRESSFLTQAVVFAQQIHDAENRSGTTIETKATALVGILGIVATLLAGVTGLLFAQLTPATQCWLVILLLAGSIVVAGACLLVSLHHTVEALGVTWIAQPDPAMYVTLQHSPVEELLRGQLATLLVSEHNNRLINDQKAVSLQEGYRYARFTAVALLAGASTMVINTVWSIWF